MTCNACEYFFSKYRCNAPMECDCPKCQGYCKCEKMICHNCKGSGLVWSAFDPYPEDDDEPDICPVCDGSGTLD